MQEIWDPGSGGLPPELVTVYVRDQVYDWTAPGTYTGIHIQRNVFGLLIKWSRTVLMDAWNGAVPIVPLNVRLRCNISVLESFLHYLPVIADMLVYSGDWAEMGEPTAGTPTEWTDLAGDEVLGDVDVGVESMSISSSPESAIVVQNKHLSVKGQNVSVEVILKTLWFSLLLITTCFGCWCAPADVVTVFKQIKPLQV